LKVLLDFGMQYAEILQDSEMDALDFSNPLRNSRYRRGIFGSVFVGPLFFIAG
jgi:hypothetical protein